MKRTTVRMPADIHEKLRKESFETGLSQNEIIVNALQEKYKERLKVKNIAAKDLLTIKQALEGEIAIVIQLKEESDSEFMKESCNNNIERYKDTLKKINSMMEE